MLIRCNLQHIKALPLTFKHTHVKSELSMAQFSENHFPSPPSIYSCSPTLQETQIQIE